MNSSVQGDVLPEYRVRAVNTAADSENKIHDDLVAAKHGFGGGLVPGVVVYGYMTVPVVGRFSMDWLARGSIRVRLHKPFYDGDPVVVRATVDRDSVPITVGITAEREDGEVCATAHALIADKSGGLGDITPAELDGPTLPAPEVRPAATRESLAEGTVLAPITEVFDSGAVEKTLLQSIGEELPIYFGPEAVAHPTFLLGLSNQLLMRNFKLGPWIHSASEVVNLGTARNGDELTVRGRVAECYERKGHEFVVLDVMIEANRKTPVQQVRHTAIYRLREP